MVEGVILGCLFYLASTFIVNLLIEKGKLKRLSEDKNDKNDESGVPERL